MPGFAGVVGQDVSSFQPEMPKAIDLTVYSGKTSRREVFSNRNITLHLSYFKFLEGESDSNQGQLHAWCDGEIYNKETLLAPNESFTSALLNRYKAGKLHEFLREVNGVYVAIIYDEESQQILVVTDRYGLKPFYISHSHGHVFLAAELKCFTAFHDFPIEIRKDVVDCFVSLEHMMNTATWFKNVDVTAPSTIYRYSITQDKLVTERYWSWERIKPITTSLPEAAEEVGRLLHSAIVKRNATGGKVGIGLSGGFDSRAILAAIRESKPITYTFGTEDSADVKNARQVAQLAGVKNIHLGMGGPGWIEKRFQGVWKVDGMLNMYHMHYSHLMNEIPKFMDVNLSGFLGDGVLGQTYLKRKGKLFLDKRADRATAEFYYGRFAAFSDPNDSFFNINKLDAYLIYNRGRRLTGLGMEEANKTIYQRMPFMDNALMDFSYALPDSFRKGNVMYHRALILRYPEFYLDIPHATSGVPIQLNPGMSHKAAKLYHRMMWILKFKMGMATSFTDVFNWIKEPEAVKLIRSMLNRETALYANFTQANFLEEYFEPHLAGKGNFMKRIMGALTMEVWLQQIMNEKYLPTDEA